VRIARIALLLLLGILLVCGFACGGGPGADYQRGYEVGYAEGLATVQCDCQYLKGEIDMDTYLDCIPEETSSLGEIESYNDGYLQGFIDGYGSYYCDW